MCSILPFTCDVIQDKQGYEVKGISQQIRKPFDVHDVCFFSVKGICKGSLVLSRSSMRRRDNASGTEPSKASKTSLNQASIHQKVILVKTAPLRFQIIADQAASPEEYKILALNPSSINLREIAAGRKPWKTSSRQYCKTVDDVVVKITTWGIKKSFSKTLKKFKKIKILVLSFKKVLPES